MMGRQQWLVMVLLGAIPPLDGFARPKSFRQGGWTLPLQEDSLKRVVALIENGEAHNVTAAVQLVMSSSSSSSSSSQASMVSSGRRNPRRRKVEYEVLSNGGSVTDAVKTTNHHKRYTLFNFYKKTGAEYMGCHPPERPPDFTSPSGSIYWDEGDHVRRQSNHWSGQHGVYKLKDCVWTINITQEIKREVLTGMCPYDEFVGLKQKKKKKKKKKK